jgi:ubiquinone/menaquinone biosynthesis C-methylase UbiE
MMLTFRQIIDKIDQLEEANILLAALEFRVFSILAKNRLSASAVARRAGTRSMEMENLLDALTAMGALRKSGGHYLNTSETYKHLCESSPHYKRGMIMLRGENHKEYPALIETIRNGRNPADYEGGDDPEFRKPFTYAMHERSQWYATQLADIVARKPVGKLIDLGGGPGSYSVAILNKDNKAVATLLDRSSAIEAAKEIHHGSKAMKRFQFLEGDLFDTDYGKGFNTVLFSNILHIYNEAQNRKLLKKIHRALVTGGRLILVDLFLDKNKTTPYEAALFSLTMLLFTATGKTYTFAETKTLLRDTDYSAIKQFSLSEGSSVIEAVKK